jgi:hypothetical protein
MSEFAAIRIAGKGIPPMQEIGIKRLLIPTWTLSIISKINWEDVTIRRYPAFDRAKERTAIA